MKLKYLCILVFALLTSAYLSAQTKAVTENGKDIIIYSDGTWQYKQDNGNSGSAQSTYIFLNDKRLPAGKKTLIHGRASGRSGPELVSYLQIAKDAEKTLIIFWQEREYVPVDSWKGAVKIYLNNNSIISLYDRNIKGENTIKDDSGFDDLHRFFSVYYLSAQDRQKLKQSNISQIIYETNDYERSKNILEISSNADTAKKQLYSLGR